MRIRDANEDEAAVLEALQRRSSDVWEQYREQLAAHPDVIELPQAFIDNGWVRVAAAGDDTPIGFSVVIRMTAGRTSSTGCSSNPSRCSAESDARWSRMPLSARRPAAGGL